MIGARKNFNGPRDLTVPISRIIHELGLPGINIPAKFEISISIHYEDMKDDTKSVKWGCLGS